MQELEQAFQDAECRANNLAQSLRVVFLPSRMQHRLRRRPSKLWLPCARNACSRPLQHFLWVPQRGTFILTPKIRRVAQRVPWLIRRRIRSKGPPPQPSSQILARRNSRGALGPSPPKRRRSTCRTRGGEPLAGGGLPWSSDRGDVFSPGMSSSKNSTRWWRRWRWPKRRWGRDSFWYRRGSEHVRTPQTSTNPHSRGDGDKEHRGRGFIFKKGGRSSRFGKCVCERCIGHVYLDWCCPNLPITPNNFWGFNTRNSQGKLHLLVLSLLGRSTPPTTPNYSQRTNWPNKFHLCYNRKFSGNNCVILKGPMVLASGLSPLRRKLSRLATLQCVTAACARETLSLHPQNSLPSICDAIEAFPNEDATRFDLVDEFFFFANETAHHRVSICTMARELDDQGRSLTLKADEWWRSSPMQCPSQTPDRNRDDFQDKRKQCCIAIKSVMEIRY